MGRILLLMDSYFDWRSESNCKSLSVEQYDKLFFPPNGRASAAKLLCSTCPVKDLCLEWALDRPEVRGIWGGTSFKERMKMLDKLKPVIVRPVVKTRTNFRFS